MIADVKCPSCPFRARAKIPDGAKKVKCPKCGTRIELAPPAEEEFYVDEIIEEEPELTLAPLQPLSQPAQPPAVTTDEADDDDDAPPMVTAAPVPEAAWDLTQPRSFGICARAIMG